MKQMKLLGSDNTVAIT